MVVGKSSLERWVVISLGVLVIAAYAPVHQNEFVWDDYVNFVTNKHYRGFGWSQIRWAWWTFMIGVYQPVAWMALEVQYLAFGPDPGGYHSTSVVLHYVNTILVFMLTLRLIRLSASAGPFESNRSACIAAGLAAALFAVHPQRVEVVAWASCQPYLWCALFFLLTIYIYLGSDRLDPRLQPLGSACTHLFCAAALLSKAVAVGLPAVIILLDFYPLRRLGSPRDWLEPQARDRWGKKTWYVAMGAACLAVAFSARTGFGGFTDLKNEGLLARALNAGHSVCFYLEKAVLPFHLSACYEMSQGESLSSYRYAIETVIVAFVSISLVALRRLWPGALVAWLSYLLILAPNLGLVRTGTYIAADRYSYLAEVGLFVFFGVGLSTLMQAGRRIRLRTNLILLSSVVLIIGLTMLSRRQCATWETEETLWKHAVASGHEGIVMSRYNLIAALRRVGKYSEAAEQYRELVRRDPDNAVLRDWYGQVLLETTDGLDAAIEEFSEAVRLVPYFKAACQHLEDAEERKLVVLDQGMDQIAGEGDW